MTKLCTLCVGFIKSLVEWQTVWTLFRLLWVCTVCMPFCQKNVHAEFLGQFQYLHFCQVLEFEINVMKHIT